MTKVKSKFQQKEYKKCKREQKRANSNIPRCFGTMFESHCRDFCFCGNNDLGFMAGQNFIVK